MRTPPGLGPRNIAMVPPAQQPGFVVVQPTAILGGPPTPLTAYRRILCVPWMNLEEAAGRLPSRALIEPVQMADLVICKSARILKDRFGLRGRGATIEELFAVHETIYLTE